MSFTFIGNFFGGRDHTTAMYAKQNILNLMFSDQKIKQQVKDIESKL